MDQAVKRWLDACHNAVPCAFWYILIVFRLLPACGVEEDTVESLSQDRFRGVLRLDYGHADVVPEQFKSGPEPSIASTRGTAD